MRQSEQRFRLLVEHAPEASVILDVATGKFVEANKKASELFGLSRAQLLESALLELSAPVQSDGATSAERAQQLLAATLAGESPAVIRFGTESSPKSSACTQRTLSSFGSSASVA
jgi:PAS domain S-box-containing protein